MQLFSKLIKYSTEFVLYDKILLPENNPSKDITLEYKKNYRKNT